MTLTDDQILSEILARDIQIATGEQPISCLTGKENYILPANQHIIEDIVRRDIKKVYGDLS
jgi:hypothetical protein